MNRQNLLQGMGCLTLATLLLVACGTPATTPIPTTAAPTRVPSTATLAPLPPTAKPSPVFPTSTPTASRTSQWAKFDRWGIAFEYPTKWTEWSAEKLSAVKSYLNAQATASLLGPIQEATIIATSDQEAAVMIGVSQGTLTIERLLTETQSAMDSYKAAGEVTKIWRIEQISVAGKPAVIADVERGARGRGYAVTILSGERNIQIQCVVQNLQRFAAYEPDFNHVFQTLTLTP